MREAGGAGKKTGKEEEVDIGNAVERMRGLIAELGKSFNVKAAIGEPIDVEDKILIPVAKIGAGGGGGFGSGRERGAEEKGGGGGFGVGGGVDPIGIVVILKGVPGPDGVRLYELRRPGMTQTLGEVLPKMAETFPKIAEMFKRRTKEAEKQKEKKEKLMEI